MHIYIANQNESSEHPSEGWYYSLTEQPFIEAHPISFTPNKDGVYWLLISEAEHYDSINRTSGHTEIMGVFETEEEGADIQTRLIEMYNARQKWARDHRYTSKREAPPQPPISFVHNEVTYGMSQFLGWGTSLKHLHLIPIRCEPMKRTLSPSQY